ncbi:hypothetical protein M8J75_000869 [Diaphorina citri]|nr:hypothetical protein M8J75_000869 [Diaphorina citri]KAI5730853.1 hypothetical protein M8J77_000898 [Diaphorina citri]
MHKIKEENQYRSRGEVSLYEQAFTDGDMFLQALNGFLVILTCEGEVFFATHTIESYLGFHQSDIVHQSVYELVHSEDREELQRQLMWNSFLPPESAGISLQECFLQENSYLLERSFTVRFRCLLDNTSGFLRLDIRGRIKILHGQNRKLEEPPLALFAICTPFGPPSLLEIPHKEVMFKSKHKLDLSLVSMDQRGKMLLGYSDTELANMGGYDLVHYDDLAYVASAHQELLKTGASGMIAYRFQTNDGGWQWLQTSSRLVYKNSKPDFVISTHRPLMEEEGRDLLGKRTMDFKVSYLDAGLNNSYFSDSDQLTPSHQTLAPSPGSAQSGSSSTTPQRVNRRYKTQLRDFLSTCRTKRKMSAQHAAPPPPTPAPPIEYLTPPDAVAAAYSNMYTTGYSATTPEYMSQSLYDNRLPYENLFHQYRPYYPEYQPYTVSNGFSLPTYEVNKSNDCDKLYCHQTLTADQNSKGYSSPYITLPLCSDLPQSHKLPSKSLNSKSLDGLSSNDSSPVPSNHLVTPKVEDIKSESFNYSEVPRQTVLMWGSNPSRSPPASPILPNGHINYPSQEIKKYNGDPLKSLAEMNTIGENKWKESPPVVSPKSYYQSYNENGPSEHSRCRLRLPSDKQDGSPLLSISEVTNTLLNQ